MAMDKDSIDHLEDAKAGQKRLFVMLCSGDKILSLVAYKTGSLDQYKKQAKEGGTGKIYYGEIKGKGTSLVFELARANGFKEEPVGEQKLKKFIQDEAKLTLTPSFSVVDEHGKEPEQPAKGQPEKPKSEGASQPPNKSEPPKSDAAAKSDAPAKADAPAKDAPKKDAPPTVDPAVRKKMQDTLDKLGPLVKAVVQSHPDRKNEILKTFDRIKKGIAGDNPGEFRDDLLKYGALLKELTTAKPGGSGKEDPNARKWADATTTWEANKDAQMELVKDTMNTLGNLALDKELDPNKVNALISELSTYVPAFEKLTGAMDDALEMVKDAADPTARAAAVKAVNAAIAGLQKFYNSARIKKLLADFDGQDFFKPTEESLAAIGKLAV